MEIPPPCARCCLPRCICPALAEPSRLEILVVRHFVERHKMSGTARLIPLAVAGARIIDVGGPDSVARDQVSAGPNTAGSTFLLFPGGVPIDTVADDITALVVPDGTWAQTRRMRTRVPLLAGLRAVSLPPGPATLRLRDPRRPGELATAEAVARALDAVGDAAPARLLRTLYEAMHAQLTTGGRSTRRIREFQ